MDRFESGEIYDGLRLLDEFVAKDEFGRKGTVLKRAITLVARLEGGEAAIYGSSGFENRRLPRNFRCSSAVSRFWHSSSFTTDPHKL
jgi:hypothetical protein